MVAYLFFPIHHEPENFDRRTCGRILYQDSIEKLPENRRTKERIKDPWENPLIVERTDKHYTIYSLGRDGKLGGSGIDMDIYLSDCLKRFEK